MFIVNLPKETEARLNAIAEISGRDRNFHAVEAILKHLDDMEDLYAAEQRMIDLQEGRSGTTPLEEVLKRYGMENRI